MRFIPDDGYYYLEIARRLGTGEGSTFDGITRTNGYHPLWLLCLLPLADIMTASREMGLRLAILLGIGLVGGAFWMLDRLARIRGSRHRWLLIFLPLSMLLITSNYGMESPLVLLVLAAWLLTMQVFMGPSAGHRHPFGRQLGFATAMGTFSAALIFARLDMAMFVLCFDAYFAGDVARSAYQGFKNAKDRISPVQLWLPICVCAVIQIGAVSAYLGYNHLQYGHFLTVSALVKAGRTDTALFSWLWASWGAIPGVASGLLGIAALLLRPKKLRDPVLTVAAWGSLLFILGIAIRGRGETYHWYFAAPIFLSGLFMNAVLEALHSRFQFRIRPLAARLAIAALFCLSIYRRACHPSHPSPVYPAAKWIAAQAPPDAVFARTDCGTIAYFSERPHLNTDGLTCSFEFQDSMRAGTTADFLTAAGVNTLFSTGALPDVVTVKIRQGIYGICPVVHAHITPLPVASDKYRLWRIEALVGARGEGEENPAQSTL